MQFDGAEGRLSRVSALRTVTIRLRGLRSEQLRSFSTALCDWFQSYSDWYGATSGIAAGRNLHLVYQRNVVFSEIEDIADQHTWKTLLAAAVSAGLTPSLRLRLPLALRQRDDLLVLVKRIQLGGVVLVNRDEELCPPASTNDATDLVRALLEYAPTHFAGPYSFWQRVVLQTAVADHKCFTLSPTSPAKARRASCLGYVGCHVLEDGEIYICEHLAGVATARLGTIFATRFLPHMSPVLTDAPAWVRNGPTGVVVEDSAGRHADMCVRHAESLVAEA